MTILGARVGFLRGDYGHDFAENPRFPTWPCTFDPMHAYRPLVEAARAGRQAVRLFLCEGAEGIRVDGDGAVLGVSERLLEAIEVVQKGAALHGLYLYWSLLDAGAVAEGDTITGSILEGGAQAARFAERVAAPIARALDPQRTLGVDAVSDAGAGAAEAIARIGHAMRAEAPLVITAGATTKDLARLWPEAALDGVDVRGALPSRDALAEALSDPRVREEDVPLFAGDAEGAEGADAYAAVFW